MRGFGFEEHGSVDRLSLVEIAEPTPGPAEVRIRVRAAGFNHLDRFTLAGIPGVPIARPHVLGSDASGIVETVGPGATNVRPGERVLVNPGFSDGTCEPCRRGQDSLCRNYRILGEHTQGSVAPFVVVPARNVHPIPDRMDFPEAAAAPLVFETAWRALMTVGALRPGERVAIVGAGGGVATAALQIAKLRGASVAVASRSPAKAERARSLGADAGLTFDEAHPLDRVLWEWSGKQGVDLVFDSVGAPTLARSLQSLARGGRIVVIGATAGSKAEIELRTLFWRQVSIRGSTMASAAEFDAMLRELAAGRLRPIIDSVHPFERAREAFLRLYEPDLFGKVVVALPTT